MLLPVSIVLSENGKTNECNNRKYNFFHKSLFKKNLGLTNILCEY